MEGLKHIAILGAGESGLGAARLSMIKGKVPFVSDAGSVKPASRKELIELGVEWEEKTHNRERILASDIIVKSPGIPDKAEIIQVAKAAGKEVISEVEFAYRFARGKMIGITGSNGKSTTTALTYHILKNAGLSVEMGGNIGKSLARLVADTDPDYFVVELSSFQLDDIKKFTSQIGVLLNITPDHLDRYNYSLNDYAYSKMRIALNQSPKEYFIYNYDDPIVREQVEQMRLEGHLLPISQEIEFDEGAFIRGKEIIVQIKNRETFTMTFDELILKGQHNRYNSMAASVVARVLDVRKEAIRESLQNFKAIEHRMELVAQVYGIEFVNDSKATNVNAVWYALDSMKTPVVWIAGGTDKGNDYTALLPLVQEKVRALICLGKDNSKLKESFRDNVPVIAEANTMEQAVEAAYQFAEKGDTVLLSPACASFDLFQNYEDRGRQFKDAVKNL